MLIFFFFEREQKQLNMGDEAGQVTFLLKGKVWGTHPTHV